MVITLCHSYLHIPPTMWWIFELLKHKYKAMLIFESPEFSRVTANTVFIIQIPYLRIWWHSLVIPKSVLSAFFVDMRMRRGWKSVGFTSCAHSKLRSKGTSLPSCCSSQIVNERPSHGLNSATFFFNNFVPFFSGFTV